MVILMKRVMRGYIMQLRAKSGFVKEAEKIEWNDLKISLHILLKEAATKKKLRLRVWVTL